MAVSEARSESIETSRESACIWRYQYVDAGNAIREVSEYRGPDGDIGSGEMTVREIEYQAD